MMNKQMNRIGYIIIFVLLLSGCSAEKNLVNTARRIVFFGDSITEQGVKPNGYVTIIRNSFSERAPSFEIVGAGVSGNKITDLLARVDKDVLSKRPSIVVIYIGINDVWHFEFAARGLTGTTKEHFEAGLKELITKIRSAGAQVVLCTPSVIGEKNDGTNKEDAMLDAYSAVSRNVASETGASLCDLRKTFLEYLLLNNPSNAEKNVVTIDGVHLNDSGNQLVAESIMKVFDGLGLFFPQK